METMPMIPKTLIVAARRLSRSDCNRVNVFAKYVQYVKDRNNPWSC